MSIHRKHPFGTRVSISLIICTFALLLFTWQNANWTPLLASFLNPVPSVSSNHVYDDDVAFTARRQRPMPLCATDGHRARTFLIVFMGHSGSSAFASELRAHSQVSMTLMEPVDHQEVFNTSAALETTRRLFREGLAHGKVAGFKIRPNHILAAPQQWRMLVQQFGSRLIWQYRKNLLKAAIGDYSHKILNDSAVREGLRTNISKEERCSFGAGCRFRIDDMAFVHRALKSKLRSQNSITEAVYGLAGADGCVWEVPYEDYLYRRERTMADVQRFLGLPREHTRPMRFKATGDSMCEVVENWDEVCRHFYGCVAWQHMMDDVRNQCFCYYSSGPSTYCDPNDS